MKIVDKSDGQSVVQVHRKEVEFISDIMLNTRTNIENATVLQSVSLVIELLLFLLSCDGVEVDLSDAEMRTLVQEVDVFVREPAFERALNKFVDAWNEAGGSAWGKAKAIFYFLKDTFSLGILLKLIKLIVKLIFQNMSTWKMTKAMIKVVSMIYTAFNTAIEGLIGRIVLAVHTCDRLADNIANLVKFSDRKKKVAAVDLEEDDVVKKVSIVLKTEHLIPEYKKHEMKIMKVLKDATQKEATLTTEMVPMIDNRDMRDVEQAMSAIIGQERVDDIKMAFAIESFSINVTEKKNGQSVVQVYRNGVPFQPERMLISIKDIETATVLQWAIIVIELFLFVLSCVGIIVCLNQAEMKALVKKVEVIVKQAAVLEALNKFMKDWNQDIFSTWRKAKDIFHFLKEIYSLGKFWEIIKLIFKDMCKWEKIKSMVDVVLMIVVAFTTEGIALIARIALAIDSHIYLKSKIKNIITLSDIKETME